VDLFTGEQTQDFAAMAALYAEVCQVVVNPASGIKTIADLKGKSVSVGDAGSGVEFNAKQILEAYGITFNDISKQNLSFGASADALRDNKIDAFFCVAGAPTTAVVDLAIGKEIAVLEIDDAHAQTLMRDYPFYTQFPVPAGTYRGQTAPANTLAVKATFIVSKKVPADTVYSLTKALFESRGEIQTAHAKGAELSTAYAVSGISIPFHPGAERYFREIGAIK
jgi:TRAP transporter TAXI family solute receptor